MEPVIVPSHCSPDYLRVELSVSSTDLNVTVAGGEIVLLGDTYDFEETDHLVTPDETYETTVIGHICIDTSSGEAVLLVDEVLEGEDMYLFSADGPYTPVVSYYFVVVVPAGATTLDGLNYELRMITPDPAEPEEA